MSKEKLSVKEWADEDKPREKMLAKGIKALSSAELIAIASSKETNRSSTPSTTIRRALAPRHGRGARTTAFPPPRSMPFQTPSRSLAIPIRRSPTSARSGAARSRAWALLRYGISFLSAGARTRGYSARRTWARSRCRS